MKQIFVFILVSVSFSLPAAARLVDRCVSVKCEGAECGCKLIGKGWTKVAECDDGHQWSYIIEKDKQRKICRGINARGGATERPCEKYDGKLSDFRQCKSAAK